ncbi:MULTISPECIES: NAD(P)/FAD-dependent oxidoreductase [Halomonadaceae]|uniref:NAD(P)/FAD-dependent oxidoreductase n=1 Tax=Halomonadaceae TaxID=28256 RepID=UPI0015978255|nr:MULTISPECIES: NAD(P)/FAD-dependent oxidoreductase [Halomonas]QJQ95832.1 NAD(P)/FAD-dependent oxidoreductase [Halomonas sp. PA5]
MEDDTLDCLVIGAGPAGLTAGLNLNRFLRRVLIIDAGHSRASLIPCTYNYPGYPDGISGNELLDQLRRQLEFNGGSVSQGKVLRLLRDNDQGVFLAETEKETLRAKTVVLATGVIDIEPKLDGFDEIKHKGLVRYCPICDGKEFINLRIGVITNGDDHGVNECLFIKHFSAELTMIGVTGDCQPDQRMTDRLDRERISLVQGQAKRIRADEHDVLHLEMEGGQSHEFDALYCSLGTSVRSELGRELGARRTEDGNLIVDAHMQTGVEGLYAVGDMTNHLSQITVATGQAAIAATAVHNRLLKETYRHAKR